MELPLRKWVTQEIDEAKASALARELDVPLPLARVLVCRGILSAEAGGAFLSPKLASLSDPFDLPGMREAVTLVWQAVEARKRILVFGDYDADGVTSTCLLAGVLRGLGGEVASFLPDRVQDGYGLKPGALARCIEEHRPALIITVDCGIGSHEAVALAADAGVDVIVTDHHEVPETPVQAAAVVNPKLGDRRELHDLAGVGVAFKLCHALVKEGLARKSTAAASMDLRTFLDLVAMGTVADMVPLTGENRILVSHGLARINREPRPGVEALVQVARVRGDVTATDLSFLIAPRLNAAGRLATADPALALLASGDVVEAGELAAGLDQANRERKRVEDSILKEAVAELDARYEPETDFGIVVAREGWHPGTIGIVASRLCARYVRPVVVIGVDDQGHGKGSCRSIPGVNMVEMLDRCSAFLCEHGGHQMAAGLSVEADRIPEFAAAFNAGCADQLRGTDLRPEQRIDGWVELRDLDRDLWDGLCRLQPTGMGNPAPVWGVRRVGVAGDPQQMGKNGEHLKMQLVSGGSRMEAVAFGMGHLEIPEGDLDVVFQLQENVFRGQSRLQMNIKDLARASNNT